MIVTAASGLPISISSTSDRSIISSAPVCAKAAPGSINEVPGSGARPFSAA